MSVFIDMGKAKLCAARLEFLKINQTNKSNYENKIYANLCYFDLRQSIDFFLKGYIDILLKDEIISQNMVCNINTINNNIDDVALEDVKNCIKEINENKFILSDIKSINDGCFNLDVESLHNIFKICEKLETFSYNLVEIA